MSNNLDTWMPNVVANDLTRMSAEELYNLATYMVKHCPEAADKVETAFCNAFYDNNFTTDSIVA